jgi:ABC-2 type transport system permease protein
MSDAGSPQADSADAQNGAAAQNGTAAQVGAAQNSGETQPPSAESKPQTEEGKPAKPELHVVFVSDIDVISSTFLQLRERPDDEINWQFENVTFVLNLIDSLAGDESLVGVRKRKLRHSTLKWVERMTEDAREATFEQSKKFEEEYKKKTEAFRAETQKNVQALQAEVDQLQQSGDRGDLETQRLIQEKAKRLLIEQAIAEERIKKEVERLERERDQKLDQINYALRQDIKEVQTSVKTYAAFLPPIPPLLVGLAVLVYRRMRESESVVAERRR